MPLDEVTSSVPLWAPITMPRSGGRLGAVVAEATVTRARARRAPSGSSFLISTSLSAI
jgi:hypothetical protein